MPFIRTRPYKMPHYYWVRTHRYPSLFMCHAGGWLSKSSPSQNNPIVISFSFKSLCNNIACRLLRLPVGSFFSDFLLALHGYACSTMYMYKFFIGDYFVPSRNILLWMMTWYDIICVRTHSKMNIYLLICLSLLCLRLSPLYIYIQMILIHLNVENICATYATIRFICRTRTWYACLASNMMVSSRLFYHFVCKLSCDGILRKAHGVEKSDTINIQTNEYIEHFHRNMYWWKCL